MSSIHVSLPASSLPGVELRPRKWTLRGRLLVLFITCSVLLGLAIASVAYQYHVVRQTSEELSQDLRVAASSLAGLNESLAVMESSLNAYALTGDVSTLGAYAQASQQADAAVGDLQDLATGDPRAEGQVADVQEALAVWRNRVTEPLQESLESGEPPSARPAPTYPNLYNDVRSLTHVVQETFSERVQAAVQQQAKRLRLLAVFIGIVAVLLVFSLWAAFLLISRSVMRPLGELRAQLQNVAGGDFETPIKPTGPPELWDVGQDAEQMRRRLVTEIDRARTSWEAVEQQLPLVRAVRGELAPPPVPSVPGLEVVGEQFPAEGLIAGDWWACDLLPDGRVAISVTDVAGHGPHAGIDGLQIKTIVRMALRAGYDPATALAWAAAGYRTPGRFATCAIVTIDPDTGDFSWANAGHLAPCLLGDGRRFELHPTGPLMSSLGGTWSNKSGRMPPGHVLLLWTDGLTETRDENGEQLSESGLLQIAERMGRHRDLRDFMTRLAAEVRGRAVDWTRDDITLIGARRTSG